MCIESLKPKQFILFLCQRSNLLLLQWRKGNSVNEKFLMKTLSDSAESWSEQDITNQPELRQQEIPTVMGPTRPQRWQEHTWSEPVTEALRVGRPKEANQAVG